MKADIYNNKLYINKNNRFTLFLPFYSSLLNRKTVYQVKVCFPSFLKWGLEKLRYYLKPLCLSKITDFRNHYRSFVPP